MKKPLVIILGLILLAILGGQTYMIYSLQQQLPHSTAKQSPSLNVKGQQGPPDVLDDDFFNSGNWDPYQEMQRMQNEMEHVFGNSFSRFHMNRDLDAFTRMPALDLKEESDRYIVKIDMPGADTGSLSIKLEGRQLTVSMKTERQETEENDKNFQRRERFSGTFERSLTLPGPVKESAMKSDYKDGVLTIVIPKA